MKVAITGASGYLASNILKSLVHNTDIDYISVIINHNKPKIKSSKIHYFSTSFSDLTKAIKDAKFVIHFAAVYRKGSDYQTVNELIQSNIALTSSIFSLAQSNPDCRVIMPTTFSMLSNSQQLRPKTFYAATKAFAELTAPLFDTKLTFLRLPDTFGSNDHRGKVIQLMKEAYDNKKKFVLARPKDFLMNIIAVEDIVNIINTLMADTNRPKHEKLDLFYPINLITMGKIINIIDPHNEYLSCIKGHAKPEVVEQKYVLQGYAIQHPIEKRLREEMNKENND